MINFILNYYECENFFGGKEKIGWYILKDENVYLLSLSVDNKTLIFIIYFLSFFS